MTTEGPRHQAPDDATAPAGPGWAADPAAGRHRAIQSSAAAGTRQVAPPTEPPATVEQPEPPPSDEPRGRRRRRHAEPAPRSRAKSALIALLGVLALAVGIGVGAITLATRHYEAAVSRVPNALPTTTNRPPTTPAAVGSVTFLLTAGEPDKPRKGAFKIDSVMLLRLAADQQHAQIVYLPLDLWLAPAGQQAGTVGGLFGQGPSTLVAAVEGVSGVRVDHYAQLNFDGFRTVTDAVGGIDVTVPALYDDHGHTYAAGPQHMNGDAALWYVRAGSDEAHLHDAAREQLVIHALFDRLGKIGALSDFGTMSNTVGAVSSALGVDSSLDDPALVRLAWDHRGIGTPAFLAAPVGGRGVQHDQQVSLPGPALDRLWADLRDDDLAGHLGDFG